MNDDDFDGATVARTFSPEQAAMLKRWFEGIKEIRKDLKALDRRVAKLEQAIAAPKGKQAPEK